MPLAWRSDLILSTVSSTVRPGDMLMTPFSGFTLASAEENFRAVGHYGSGSSQRDECIFNLLPHAGTGIDDLKVSDVRERDQFNVFAGLFLFGSVILADFIRNRPSGGTGH